MKKVKEFFDNYNGYYKVYKNGNQIVGIKESEWGSTYIIFGKEKQSGEIEMEEAFELEAGINLVKTVIDKLFNHLEIDIQNLEKEDY
jgi:hypothetical protein